MLPKKNRLSGYQIPPLVRSGKRISNQTATLIFQKTSTADDPLKCTVIVPTRLSKKAVERNRTKRLLREAIQQNFHEIQSGYECIVMAKRIFNTEKLQDIESDIRDLFNKANLIANNETLK
jgi:ribonuclease P protein component